MLVPEFAANDGLGQYAIRGAGSMFGPGRYSATSFTVNPEELFGLGQDKEYLPKPATLEKAASIVSLALSAFLVIFLIRALPREQVVFWKILGTIGVGAYAMGIITMVYSLFK